MNKIEWTQATWNPIAGCAKVSDGCKNCYAERMAHRFSHTAKYESTTENGRWTGKINFDEKALTLPLLTKKPTVFFVNSMSDLFHENIDTDWLEQIFAVMALCQQHTFQVLTKRPKQMFEFLNSWPDAIVNIAWEATRIGDIGWRRSDGGIIWEHVGKNGLINWPGWPLPNVWLGVSVENQQAADERIPLLLETPAAVRFLSCEPLLGPIDLQKYLYKYVVCHANQGKSETPPDISYSIDWVIAGGESGPGARPIHPNWARSLRDQCQAAGVPYFFKQWGEWAPCETNDGFWPVDDKTCIRLNTDGSKTGGGWPMQRVGKSHAGRILDGRTWDEMPGVSHE